MRDPLFPFTDPKCDYIQRKVVDLIESSHFFFELPELPMKAWQVITQNKAEKERLEFLGDALIGSFVSEELLRACPKRYPGFYTCIRQVLVANSTFAHLMRKAGFHDDDDNVKRSGDAFETMLAVHHADVGHKPFENYVKKYFTPLITCAGEAFDKYNNFQRSKGHRTQYKHKQHVVHGSRPSMPKKIIYERDSFQRNKQANARTTPFAIDLTHLSDDLEIDPDSFTAQGEKASSGKANTINRYNFPYARQPMLISNSLGESSKQASAHVPTLFSTSLKVDSGIKGQTTDSPLISTASRSGDRLPHPSGSSISGLQTWASFGTIDNPITIDFD